MPQFTTASQVLLRKDSENLLGSLQCIPREVSYSWQPFYLKKNFYFLVLGTEPRDA